MAPWRAAESSAPARPESQPIRVPAWLVVVFGAELVLAATLRVDGMLQLRRGADFGFHGALQVVGLVLAPALAFACLRVLHLARMSREAAAGVRQRMQDLLEVSTEWIWTIDRDGMLLDSNDTIEDILGYSASEILGTSSFRLMSPESRLSLREALASSAAKGEGWIARRSTWRHRDGTIRHLESSATAVRDSRGAVVGFHGASRNVTAETEAANVLREEERKEGRRVGRIEQVLFDDELLSIVYQPIVRLDSGRIAGIEALARFRAKPAQPPDVWFNEAAELGLGVRLEMLAIRRACTALAVLSGDQYLALNVSSDTLCSSELLRFLLDPRTRSDRIVVELTEHAAVADYDEVEAQLEKVRRLGVRLAVDDAGAGYSTLRHILRLRPDIIKLDRVITTSVDSDPARRALASAMVTFADEIGAVVVAEGIEDESEADALERAGVAFGQGYHLARPNTLDTWISGASLNPSLDTAPARTDGSVPSRETGAAPSNPGRTQPNRH